MKAKTNFAAIRNFSISDFQAFNEKLYRVHNDRGCYDASLMVSMMHRHATQILKAVRKERFGDISYHLVMVFSWSLALANRLHLDLEEEIWNRFPGVCPYCNSVPCVCGNKRAKKRKRVAVDIRFKPSSCHAFQLMFAKIYPQTLQEAASHLAEEVGEVDEAMRNFTGSHEEALYNHIVLELVDVITTIFAVATNTMLKNAKLGLDLATEMQKHFSRGCPGCKKSPCGCPYSRLPSS